MKTILVPIDFSETSTNALSFAVEMSKRSSASLTIVNVVQKGENEEEAKNKLEALASDLKKTLGSELTFKSSIVIGDFITSLEKVISSQQPDIIVMGTKGASGLKRVLLGSNTVNVISKTNVPVFIIPEMARFKDFLKVGKNRIILATDLDSVKNEDALDILKEIALLIIEPKIRVLNVRRKNTELGFTESLERNLLLSLFKPEIECERITVFSDNVMNGINFYLDKHEDTGLIAMIARDSGQLIQKHYTREMASHTHFPLLIMHDA